MATVKVIAYASPVRTRTEQPATTNQGAMVRMTRLLPDGDANVARMRWWRSRMDCVHSRRGFVFPSAPSAPFKLAVIHRAGVVMVIPRGEVDSFTAPTLEEALHNTRGLVFVDLSDVVFMNLRGVDAIIRGAGYLADRGGHLTVRYLSRPVWSMFDLRGQVRGLSIDRATIAPAYGDGTPWGRNRLQVLT